MQYFYFRLDDKAQSGVGSALGKIAGSIWSSMRIRKTTQKTKATLPDVRTCICPSKGEWQCCGSWFNADTDPDPEVQVNPDTNPKQGVWWPKIGKKYSWIIFFWSKTAIYLSLGLHKGRPCYRRSLQPSKENIQHFLFFYFCGTIFSSWIRIANLDPDLGTPLNPDPKNRRKVKNKNWTLRKRRIF